MFAILKIWLCGEAPLILDYGTGPTLNNIIGDAVVATLVDVIRVEVVEVPPVGRDGSDGTDLVLQNLGELLDRLGHGHAHTYNDKHNMAITVTVIRS